MGVFRRSHTVAVKHHQCTSHPTRVSVAWRVGPFCFYAHAMRCATIMPFSMFGEIVCFRYRPITRSSTPGILHAGSWQYLAKPRTTFHRWLKRSGLRASTIVSKSTGVSSIIVLEQNHHTAEQSNERWEIARISRCLPFQARVLAWAKTTGDIYPTKTVNIE